MKSCRATWEGESGEDPATDTMCGCSKQTPGEPCQAADLVAFRLFGARRRGVHTCLEGRKERWGSQRRHSHPSLSICPGVTRQPPAGACRHVHAAMLCLWHSLNLLLFSASALGLRAEDVTMNSRRLLKA